MSIYTDGAKTYNEQRKRAKDIGIIRFETKPLLKERLAKAVRESLDSKKTAVV